MKNLLHLSLGIMLLTSILLAGGMVHNSNQSAEYIAMMNRNASTDLDAAFFNPAALTGLNDGFQFYLSNQTIWQTRTVVGDFSAYNNNTFEGTTFAPAFPNVYLIFKQNKLAFSAGFMPIGGGGSAEFPDGLPSFDYQLARFVGLPASALNEAVGADLSAYGTFTGYSVSSGFTGSSVYFSGQGSVSYALSDMISVAVGIRYISALNTYDGNLESATLETSSGAPLAGVIPDITVESKRTGTAITPTLNVNLNPMAGMNLSVRFEPKTQLVLTSDTKEDGTIVLDGVGMFPDATEYNEDLPMQVSVGLGYQLGEKLKLQASYDFWDNPGVNWDGREDKVTTNFEGGLGLEYRLTDAISIMYGYLYAATGATPEYQTDLSYGLDTHTFAAGLRYALNPTTSLTLGASNTLYNEADNGKTGNFRESYDKTARVIAIGLSKTR